MSKVLSIDRIGLDLDNESVSDKNLIYRLSKKPPAPTSYYYLAVSEEISNLQDIDILTIKDFRKLKDVISKKVKSGLGIEARVSDARRKDGMNVAKWFKEIGELYRFCGSANHQFILSSGANSITEMISGICFDSILRNCEINPPSYWFSLNRWLDGKLSSRVMKANAK